MKKTLLFLLVFSAICRPVFSQNTPVDEFIPGVKWGMTMNDLFETRLGLSNSDGGNEGIGPFFEQMDGNPIVQAGYTFYAFNNSLGLRGLSNITFDFLDEDAALATAREFAGPNFAVRERFYWTLDDGSRVVMSLARKQMFLAWMPLLGNRKN